METDNEATKAGQQDSRYADLKKELIEIAAILEKYPDALRPKAFEVLLCAYRGQFPSTLAAATQIQSEGSCQPTAANEHGSSIDAAQAKESKARKKAPDTYSIDPDLNLHGSKDISSFEDFVNEKKPNSNAEFNTVAVYYITKILKQPRASLKQTWTCYKDVKRRTPEFFKQSFTDTKNKTGNIKFTDDGDLEITGRGENFVEHDLPPPITSKT